MVQSVNIENVIIKDTVENKVSEQNLFLMGSSISPSSQKPVQFFVKRCIDFVGTILGVAVISPLLFTIAVMIKIDSKGSILFKQRRRGYNGKEFYIYKFRSMYINAEEELGELKKYNQTNELMFKMFDDPRITKVGKFLRKYSLDELPQLINVLRGEMSLVGFRPPLPNEVDCYQKRHYIRFSVLPGLTGPWQIGGRSKIKFFDEVIKLEYEYVKNWSLLKDFEILFKTIPVILFGKNAA